MTFDLALDAMGAQPFFFQQFTALAFMFRVPADTPDSTITAVLSNGVDRLTAAFPWVAGQVVNINPDLSGLPSYRIRPYEPTPRLIIKDYRNETSVPSLEDMERARYPMSMMDEKTWAPCPNVTVGFDPFKPSGNLGEVAPVFLIQASFIKGGMVLCFSMQHNMCDMIGQGVVMEWFAKACRGEEFTEDELRVGNANRAEVVKLIEEEGWTPGAELEHQVFAEPSTEVVPAPVPDADPLEQSVPSEWSWVYFNFNEAALAELRRQANASLPDGYTSYVSTDDVLTAFVAQRITEARNPRLSKEPDCNVLIGRALNVRRYLGVSPKYPGLLLNGTYSPYPLQTLLDTPLGHIAAGLRLKIAPSEDSSITYRTRSFITFIGQSPENATKVNVLATIRTDRDLVISSWSKVDGYQFDFGKSIGKPSAVRRPESAPFETMTHFMPKDSQGSIGVATCLRKDDLERMLKDPVWLKSAEYIG